MIHTTFNCNQILSFKNYKLHDNNLYNNIEINNDIMCIEHINNNNSILRNSMGISWNVYKRCITDFYTLTFYATGISDNSVDKLFNIYIGDTEIDWITINTPLTKNEQKFTLTAKFYFNGKTSSIGIKTGFRIGFTEPEGNMKYSIRNLQLVPGHNEIPYINYDYRIFYLEPRINKNSNWNNTDSLSNHISTYNTDHNILVQPYDFIIKNEIIETDIFIVNEPPSEQSKSDKKKLDSFKSIKDTIIYLTTLFKRKYIFFYELPTGYKHHMWKVESNFLSNFTAVFSQIAYISDNKKYFWTPINISYMESFTDIDIIPFKLKKILVNCPISSGYNIRRINLINSIATYYDIDTCGKVFNKNGMGGDMAKKKLSPFTEKTIKTFMNRGINKANIFKHYKFTIVCENCFSFGYISERLFDVIVSGSIPIYYGDRNIDLFFPEKLNIINGQSFNNIHEMYRYINNITENEYDEMIKSNLSIIPYYIENCKWNNIWNGILDKIFDSPCSNSLLDIVNKNLNNFNKINTNMYNISIPDCEGKLFKYKFKY